MIEITFEKNAARYNCPIFSTVLWTSDTEIESRSKNFTRHQHNTIIRKHRRKA